MSLGAEDASLIDRREFLWRFGGGLGGIALAHLLATEQVKLDDMLRIDWDERIGHLVFWKRTSSAAVTGAATTARARAGEGGRQRPDRQDPSTAKQRGAVNDKF